MEFSTQRGQMCKLKVKTFLGVHRWKLKEQTGNGGQTHKTLVKILVQLKRRYSTSYLWPKNKTFKDNLAAYVKFNVEGEGIMGY